MQKSFYPQQIPVPGGNQRREAITTLHDLLQQEEEEQGKGGEKQERFYKDKKITQCIQCGDEHTSERRRCWKCYKRNARTKNRADQYGLAQVVLEAVRERMLRQLPPPQKRQEGEDPADPAIERERRRKFLDTPLGSLCRHISRVLEQEDDMWFYDFVKNKLNIKPARIHDVPASLLMNNVAFLRRVQKATPPPKSAIAQALEDIAVVGEKRKRAPPQDPSLSPKSTKRQKTNETGGDNDTVVAKKKRKTTKEKKEKRPRGRPAKARALDPLPPSPSLTSLLAASPVLYDDSDSEEQDFHYASCSSSSSSSSCYSSDDYDDENDDDYSNGDGNGDGDSDGDGEKEESELLPEPTPAKKTKKKKAVTTKAVAKKKKEKTPRIRKTKATTFRPQKKFVDAYEENAVVESETRDCQLDPMELLQKLRDQDGGNVQTPAHLRDLARKQEQEEIRMEELYQDVDLNKATGLDISELNSRAAPATRKGTKERSF